MKSILLSFFVLLSLSQVRASDTLTVRQVFNFNVGDTFDYAQTRINYDLNIHSIQYNRLVISQKQISPSQDSIIYNGHWVITNLDSVAVYQIDTVTTPIPSVIYIDTTSISGYSSNQIRTSYFEGWDQYTATQGMGVTYSQQGRIDNSGGNFNTTTTNLIYYSNGIHTWGTPYYITEGLTNVYDNYRINISPNPTSSQLRLTFSNAIQHNTQLILTNLLGEQVYSSPITQSESTHDISNLSPGMYTWRVMTPKPPKGGLNTIVGSGKIVKE